MCGKCKSDRVSEPHYFCSEACYAQAWPAHKLWHKQVSETIKQMIDFANLRPGDVQPPIGGADSLYREGYAAMRGKNLKSAMKCAKRLREYNPYEGHKLIGIIKCIQEDRLSSTQSYEAAMQSVPCGTEAWGEALACSVEQRRLMYPCTMLCCPCTNCSAITEPLPDWMRPDKLKLLAEKMPISRVRDRHFKKETFHALANAFDNLYDPSQAAVCYAHVSMLCDADDPEKITFDAAASSCMLRANFPA